MEPQCPTIAGDNHNAAKSLHRAKGYQKVRDGGKRPIRGLWVRNGRYYARLKVEDPDTGHKTNLTKWTPLTTVMNTFGTVQLTDGAGTLLTTALLPGTDPAVNTVTPSPAPQNPPGMAA